MKPPVFFAALLILVLLAAGCTTTGNPPGPGTAGTLPVTPAETPALPAPFATGSPSLPVATTRPVTLPVNLSPSATPDENLSSYILMDSTPKIPGEVASFHIYNHGPGDLRCHTTDPAYAVFARTENGTWNGKSIASFPSNRTIPLVLNVGDSTKPYRFVTAGWKAGQYQLVVNCEVNGRSIFREFDVKEKPAVMIFN
jgi:hypothetical protein